MRILLVEDEVAPGRDHPRRPARPRASPSTSRTTASTGCGPATEHGATTRSCWTSCCPASTATRCAEQLRAREVWTPVLMLTAKDGEYDQADAFDLGADDYLTKPFSFVVLVARLRALIRRGAPARPAVLTRRRPDARPGRRRVRRGGDRDRADAARVRACWSS